MTSESVLGARRWCEGASVSIVEEVPIETKGIVVLMLLNDFGALSRLLSVCEMVPEKKWPLNGRISL